MCFKMETDSEKRKVALQDLSDFIQSSQCALENTLQILGWDENKLTTTKYKTCPFNLEHQVPEKTLERHMDACKLRLEGYSNDVQFLPDPGSSAESYIILDEETRANILHKASKEVPEMRTSCPTACSSHPVPRTSDRIFASTTPDERTALYDYVVEKTRQRHSHDLPLELPFPGKAESRDAEPRSALEVRAKERDAKRRSVSYKKVHTSRKSHTEILREVIQNQMELLQSHGQSEK